MTFGTRCRAIAGLVAAFVAWGAAAQAHVIDYTVSGYASGSYDFTGQPSVGFSDVKIDIDVYAETSKAFKPAFDHQTIVPFFAATLSAGGNTWDIPLDPSTAWLAVFDPVGKVVDFADYYAPGKVFTTHLIAYSPAFATYPGLWGVGPLPVNAAFFTDVSLANGADVTFDKFTEVTFTASVPETAAWLLMIMGVAATGAVLRARRTGARSAEA